MCPTQVQLSGPEIINLCNSFPCAHVLAHLKVSAAGDKCPALRFLCVPIAVGALFVEGKQKQKEKSFRICF